MLAIICSCGWHESVGIMVSVCVGFLYIANSSFVLFRCIVRSRELMELCCSFSIVNFILVFCLLNFLVFYLYLFYFGLDYENVVHVSEISNYLLFP
jgi:hypothetical protein